MKISIIIPTCNRPELIVKCLDCLHPDIQTAKTSVYEIIVTDDSTNDISQKLIIDKYKYVKWIKGPRKGPAANRNNGANESLFEWLIFIDDDCLPSSQIIQTYYDEIIKGKFKALEGAIDVDRPQNRFDEEAPVNLEGGLFWSCNIAIEKKIFIQLHGFDENFPFPTMEDVDFYKRVNDLCAIKFLPDAKVIHPWRVIKPFKRYRKWLKSHGYILRKNNSINMKYRWTRIKILLGYAIFRFKELANYNFIGYKVYLEHLWFNFLMIFLRK